jgi:predicted tellurium resistance membrane protein TerC
MTIVALIGVVARSCSSTWPPSPAAQPSFARARHGASAGSCSACAVALPLWAIDGGDGAVNYLTVYLIERTLSLDNLFVFLLIFGLRRAAPAARQAPVLGHSAGAVARGAAILVGVELIERFRGSSTCSARPCWCSCGGSCAARTRTPTPGRVGRRAVRRTLPVGEHYHGARFLAREDGRLVATPMVLALAGVVTAARLAVDSIPRFAITTDALAIWTANAFALWACARCSRWSRSSSGAFATGRDDRRRAGHRRGQAADRGPLQVGPIASPAIVLGAFVVGITASILRDRRDPAAPPSGERPHRRPSAGPAPSGVQRPGRASSPAARADDKASAPAKNAIRSAVALQRVQAC